MDKYIFKILYGIGLKNKKIVKYIAKLLPLFFIVIYSLGIIYVAVFKNTHIIKFICVPLFTLLSVSIIRKLVKRKRPFEKIPDIEPIIHHENGESFPSRHTVSSVIISMAFIYINPQIGIIMLIISFFVGLSRIMAGVHYPSDVLSGIIYSIIIGYLGFFII